MAALFKKIIDHILFYCKSFVMSKNHHGDEIAQSLNSEINGVHPNSITKRRCSENRGKISNVYKRNHISHYKFRRDCCINVNFCVSNPKIC